VTTGGTELRARGPELDALHGALEALERGAGALALVGGEVGIGKTRLLDAACAEALERGVGVHRGTGEELELDRPFGPRWRGAVESWASCCCSPCVRHLVHPISRSTPASPSPTGSANESTDR
jgi:hypothetical protein